MTDGEVVEVDARGMRCPRPVIELALAVADLEAGQRVRVLADDPASEVDVPVWCRMKRQRLVDLSEDAGTFTFVIEVT